MGESTYLTISEDPPRAKKALARPKKAGKASLETRGKEQPSLELPERRSVKFLA